MKIQIALVLNIIYSIVDVIAYQQDHFKYVYHAGTTLYLIMYRFIIRISRFTKMNVKINVSHRFGNSRPHI